MDNPQLIRRTQSPFVASGTGQGAGEHQDHHHHHFGHAVHTHLGAGLRPQAVATTLSPQSHHGHRHEQDTGPFAAANNDPIPFSSATSVGQSHHHGIQGATAVATEPQHHHHSHHHHQHQHQTESHGFTPAVNSIASQQHQHIHDHHHEHSHHGHDHARHHHHHHHDHGFGHDHAHSHGHNHTHTDGHVHAHHGHTHGHEHDHHHHHHHHVSAPSHLPSYSAIFANLMPRQKTLFTWMVIHSVVATFTWLSGLSSGSLAITGLGYMLMFDAMGILNIFVSSVVHTDSRFKKSTARYPFGVQRAEVLFGLSNAIFLLFIGMNMLKESLEHLMLEDDHHGGGDHHGVVVRIPLFWTVISLGATLVGALGYQNHKQFCLLLQDSGSSSWSSAAAYNQKTLSIVRNQFSLATLACVAGVILVWLLPAVDGLDKLIAIGQSIVMFALGGPLTKVLGMILLQTTPPMALESVEDTIRQLAATDGSVLGLDRSHVWANTYGQLVGTLVVRIAKEADEALTLKAIQQRLFSVLDVDPHVPGTGELTVQLVRR